MRIGVFGSMDETTCLLLSDMEIEKRHELAKRTFYEGRLYGQDAVIVISRWGKVAAATVTTLLIEKFNVDVIIFTTLTGAISEKLNIGDVVIPNELIQYDMDPRPIYRHHELPLLGITSIQVNPKWVDCAIVSANRFLSERLQGLVSTDELHEMGITRPTVFSGITATGDRFIESLDEVQEIACDIPDVLCVEMEAAAIAQVCYEFDKPFVIVLTVSDNADHSAKHNFEKFLDRLAKNYAHDIVRDIISTGRWG